MMLIMALLLVALVFIISGSSWLRKRKAKREG